MKDLLSGFLSNPSNQPLYISYTSFAYFIQEINPSLAKLGLTSLGIQVLHICVS